MTTRHHDDDDISTDKQSLQSDDNQLFQFITHRQWNTLLATVTDKTMLYIVIIYAGAVFVIYKS